MTKQLKNIIKLSNYNLKILLIIIIKVQHILEKNNINKQKNVSKKLLILIKNKLSHMHG